jgi:hypothetical protein
VKIVVQAEAYLDPVVKIVVQADALNLRSRAARRPSQRTEQASPARIATRSHRYPIVT